ncbi:MAG: hypothetical protein K6C32_01430 [Bacilli bacterium]|nr:hypothetical protein [Bacilli bacterium]
MKVRIPFKRIFLLWLAVFVIGGGLLFLCSWSFFVNQKWTFLQPCLIGAYVLFMGVILLLSSLTQYYEITKDALISVKFGKKMYFRYAEIIYIDEKQSEKSKVLTFVTQFGHVIYLNFDKEGKIYETVKSKCKNLLPFEQIKKKYPNIKI